MIDTYFAFWHLWIFAWFVATGVSATQHHFFVGSYGTSTIYGLAFDDVANSLSITKNNTTRSENPYLALSYDARTLYSSGLDGWSSFPVRSSDTVGNETALTPQGVCNTWNGMFLMASKKSPYTVYGSLSCANQIAVKADGQLHRVTEVSYTIPTSSGATTSSKAAGPYVRIYGMAMDPTYTYVYSADYNMGKIWTHKVGNDGSLALIGSVDAPSGVCAPRTLIVHPSGKMLYAVLEAWNVIAAYRIDPTTRLPVFTGGLWNLVPPDAISGNYGSISATLSRKGSTLYATANSHIPTSPGYITAFSISEAGMIDSQLFQAKTTTSGGRGNLVSAAPWHEGVVALSESQNGTITLLKWEKQDRRLRQLAHVSIHDGRYEGSGCCGEVAWVD